MTHEKRDRLQLVTWLNLMFGLAMSVPGILVLGAMEYVCGYLIFSALLVLCVLALGDNLEKIGPKAEDMNQWY